MRYAAWLRVVGYLCLAVRQIAYIHVMSRKYKFSDQDKLYFVSFAVVYWIDLFIRKEYKDIIISSLHCAAKRRNWSYKAQVRSTQSFAAYKSGGSLHY